MPPRTIILCDDAASYRRVLRCLIATDDRWLIAAEAANGCEAIVAVGTHQPDVLLLDVSMPVLSGIEALPAIREASPGTRIVLVTGYLGAEVLAEARRHGVTDVVDKAAGLAALRGALDRCASD